jgi:hypothetical protein
MRKKLHINKNEEGCGFHDVKRGRIDRSFTPEEMEIYCFLIGGLMGK